MYHNILHYYIRHDCIYLFTLVFAYTYFAGPWKYWRLLRVCCSLLWYVSGLQRACTHVGSTVILALLDSVQTQLELSSKTDQTGACALCRLWGVDAGARLLYFDSWAVVILQDWIISFLAHTVKHSSLLENRLAQSDIYIYQACSCVYVYVASGPL